MPIKNFLWRVFEPAGFFVRHTVGNVFPFFDDLFHLRSILKQNKDLIDENLQLQSRLTKMSEVEYENEILKKELGFSKIERNQQLIPAAIIGQSSGYLKSMVIDKGASDGVEKGSAVISQGYLVGTVSEVRDKNSEVTLITSFNSLIPVTLQDSRGTGLLRGGISGLAVEEIPLNVGVKGGEKVVTSGLGGLLPDGIVVGDTKEIISTEGEIFQKISVSSPIDFYRLEVLFVLKKDE